MNDAQVWTTILDARFTITVNRTAPFRGELTIADDDKVLHREPVDLAYDAQFGPDVDDVELWQNKAFRFAIALDNQGPAPTPKND